MRDLFFKTTKAKHPSRIMRFVYTFLRLRQRAVFFVRPRSRVSLYFRLQVLRKMFCWLYTDRFSRQYVFRRFVRQRTTTFRSFLDFCTTLETYIPVVLYRLHFVDNMRNSFYALRCGFIFKNGCSIRRPTEVLRFGDFVEVLYDDLFKWVSFRHLIACLPTLRFRLTLRDSIVNTNVFYALLVRGMSFFSLSHTSLVSHLDSAFFLQQAKYFNPQYRQLGFISFFLSRIFLSCYRFDPLTRFSEVRRVHLPGHFFQKRSGMYSRGVKSLWWYTPTGFLTLVLQHPAAPSLSHSNVVERDYANVPDFLPSALDSIYSFQGSRVIVTV